MSCLYIDRRSVTLQNKGNVLIVSGESGRIATIPLKVIERICLCGNVHLTASLLAKLGELDIAVLVLQGLQQKPTMLLPSFRKDALRRQVQYFLSKESKFCLSLMKNIIGAKINAQLNNLEQLINQHWRDKSLLQKISSYRDQIHISLKGIMNLEALLGLEGSAATFYFRNLIPFIPASLSFKGRNKRPPKDPFNVVLSLGYTLLHQEWVREIYLMGLDPYIGFFHQPAFGRESLASDLLEPLRPHYDLWALSLFKERILRNEDFSYKEEGCFMGKAGRSRFYEAYEEFLKSIRPLIRAQKHLLFTEIGLASDRWKVANNLKQTFGIFDPQSLDEKRV